MASYEIRRAENLQKMKNDLLADFRNSNGGSADQSASFAPVPKVYEAQIT